jgi:hypothetical protein
MEDYLMQSMQDFHNWLFSETEVQDDYRKDLVRLTQADLSQLRSIANALVWLPWDTPTSEVANP